MTRYYRNHTAMTLLATETAWLLCHPYNANASDITTINFRQCGTNSHCCYWPMSSSIYLSSQCANQQWDYNLCFQHSCACRDVQLCARERHDCTCGVPTSNDCAWDHNVSVSTSNECMFNAWDHNVSTSNEYVMLFLSWFWAMYPGTSWF